MIPWDEGSVKRAINAPNAPQTRQTRQTPRRNGPDMGQKGQDHYRKTSRHLSPIYHQTATIYHLGPCSGMLPRLESTDNRPISRNKRPTLDAKPASRNLSTNYRQFGEIYRSVRRTGLSRNLPGIYRQPKQIYRWRLSRRTTYAPEYPQPIRNPARGYPQPDTRLAVLYRATKWGRVPTVERPTPLSRPCPSSRPPAQPIVRSVTGQLQETEAERVTRYTKKVPTASTQSEDRHD